MTQKSRVLHTSYSPLAPKFITERNFAVVVTPTIKVTAQAILYRSKNHKIPTDLWIKFGHFTELQCNIPDIKAFELGGCTPDDVMEIMSTRPDLYEIEE